MDSENALIQAVNDMKDEIKGLRSDIKEERDDRHQLELVVNTLKTNVDEMKQALRDGNKRFWVVVGLVVAGLIESGIFYMFIHGANNGV